MEKMIAKLGEAFYTHKQLIKKAQEAQEAVEYLDKEGLFTAVKAED